MKMKLFGIFLFLCILSAVFCDGTDSDDNDLEFIGGSNTTESNAENEFDVVDNITEQPTNTTVDDDQAEADTDERIFGGQQTSIERVPWQVSLRQNNEHRCGGSIISNNFVITAGHCTP